MSTNTQVKSKIDMEFACPSDEGRKYEKHLDFERLSELTISELNVWIDEYITHIREILNQKEPKLYAR